MIGGNKTYNPQASKPMLVTEFKNFVMDDIWDKLYGPVSGRGAITIPRHLNMYWTHVTARRKRQANTPELVFTHGNGPQKLDKYVDKFLINTAIGQDIINYEYIPNNGILLDSRFSDFPNIDNKYNVPRYCTTVSIIPDKRQGADGTQRAVEGLLVQSRQDVDNFHNFTNTFTSSVLYNLSNTMKCFLGTKDMY